MFTVMIKKVFFITFMLITAINYAQKNPENLLGSWYMYNGSHKLTERFTLKTAIHFRYFELIEEYQQEIYRLGVNYKITKQLNFTLGAVYSIKDESYKENLPDLYEYRFYQDLNLKDKWGKFNVKHRIRSAQRFRRKNFENSTTHRIRYGLFVNYPISNTFTTYAFNEVFIKFATKSFGENRTGFGFLQQITNQVKLKLGYMYTQFSKTQSHRLQIGVIVNTNPIKK